MSSVYCVRASNNSAPQQPDDSRFSVIGRILDAKDRASQSKPNFTKLFTKKPH